MSDHPKVRSFFFNFILNYANSQLKFKIQASRFWRITSSFSRLQLKYWPKFDQLTHCYTLFTVPDVGDTGKNEGKRKEVEVTPVSIAHDVRKWLSDNAVSVAVFAKGSHQPISRYSVLASQWATRGISFRRWTRAVAKNEDISDEPSRAAKAIRYKNHER